MTKKEIEKIVSEIKKMFDKTGEIPSSSVDKVKDYLGKMPLPLQFYFGVSWLNKFQVLLIFLTHLMKNL